MSKSKKETKKRKRKEKQKKIKKGRKREAAIEKGDYFYFRARDSLEAGNPEKALGFIKKAARMSPNDPEILGEMGHIGMLLKDVDLQVRAFDGLKALGLAHPELWYDIALMLAQNDRYAESLSVARECLSILPELDIKNKRERKKQLKEIEAYCQYHLAFQETQARVVTGMNTSVKKVPRKRVPETAVSDAPAEQTMAARAPVQPDTPPAPSEMPFTFHLDSQSFYDALLDPQPAKLGRYGLAIESYEIRFKASFEHLIALTGLANVRSLWYQE